MRARRFVCPLAMGRRRSGRIVERDSKRSRKVQRTQQELRGGGSEDDDLEIDSDSDSDAGFLVDAAALEDSGCESEPGSDAEGGEADGGVGERWIRTRNCGAARVKVSGGEFCTLTQDANATVALQAPLLRAVTGSMVVRLAHVAEECAIVSLCLSRSQLLQTVPRSDWPSPLQREPPHMSELIILENLNVDLDYEFLEALCPVKLALPGECCGETFCYRTLCILREQVRVLVESTASRKPQLADLWATYQGQHVTSDHPLCEALRQLGASGCCYYGSSPDNPIHDPFVQVLRQCQPPVPLVDRCAIRGLCNACHRVRLCSDYRLGNSVSSLGIDCAERLRAVALLQNTLQWHHAQKSPAAKAVCELLSCVEHCADVVDRQAQKYQARNE